MTEAECSGGVEIIDIKEESPDIEADLKEKTLNVSKNGDSSVEVRSKRPRTRNTQAYNLDTLNSDSDPQSDADADPEFVPSSTPMQTPGKISAYDVTGFALFCNDNGESVLKKYPAMPLNKIRMKLSSMWSSLPTGTKRSYSSRARYLRPDYTKKSKKELKKELTLRSPPEVVEEIQETVVAFCCLWGRCDFQFEMVDECAQHISEDHLRLLCVEDSEAFIAPASCCWRGCLRQKRCSLPFVRYDRLLRHMSEEHVLVGKPVGPSERSLNFISRKNV